MLSASAINESTIQNTNPRISNDADGQRSVLGMENPYLFCAYFFYTSWD